MSAFGKVFLAFWNIFFNWSSTVCWFIGLLLMPAERTTWVTWGCGGPRRGPTAKVLILAPENDTNLISRLTGTWSILLMLESPIMAIGASKCGRCQGLGVPLSKVCFAGPWISLVGGADVSAIMVSTVFRGE